MDLGHRKVRCFNSEGNLVYHRPTTLEDVLALLSQASGMTALLAGGTDLLPRWSKGTAGRPDCLVDLKHIPWLTGVLQEDGNLCIGPCTPMSQIERDPLIRALALVLSRAAGRIACPQVRNRATIGGNLCNASPAADTAIPLILLDATLHLASATPSGLATREVAITDFFLGPGSTALAPNEFLTSIRFAPFSAQTYAAWDKFGTRPAMEIAVASVGLAVTLESGIVTRARVGYGSVAPVPLRGRRAEAELVGNPLSAKIIEKCAVAARNEISPISDVRAGAAYRREIVAVMLTRLLERAAGS